MHDEAKPPLKDKPRSTDPLKAALDEPDPLVRYEALTAAQTAYEELVKRIAAERARAVSEMHKAGLSYGRIAEVIGFTRSRAQQLVERAEATPNTKREGWLKPMNIQDQLIAFLRSYVKDWPRADPYAFMYGMASPMADRYSAEEVAKNIASLAEFRAMQFGTWLGTPSGQIITAAVESLAPPLIARDVELLVEALTMASKMERERRTRNVGTALALAASVALVAAAARG